MALSSAVKMQQAPGPLEDLLKQGFLRPEQSKNVSSLTETSNHAQGLSNGGSLHGTAESQSHRASPGWALCPAFLIQ